MSSTPGLSASVIAAAPGSRCRSGRFWKSAASSWYGRKFAQGVDHGAVGFLAANRKPQAIRQIVTLDAAQDQAAGREKAVRIGGALALIATEMDQNEICRAV